MPVIVLSITNLTRIKLGNEQVQVSQILAVIPTLNAAHAKIETNVSQELVLRLLPGKPLKRE